MAGAPKGNKNARRENHLITDELRRVCMQSPEKLKKACEKVLKEAMEGNLNAFNVLADRLEGRPAQSVNLGGQPDNPVLAELRRTVVDPKHTDS